MRRFLLRTARALALLFALAAIAHADAVTPTPYKLSSSSNLAWGCMGPCACPVIFTGSLQGGFTLVQKNVDPLYTHYDVLGIAWRYVVPGTDRVVDVTGHGTYQLGGEFARMERLQLDLVSDGLVVQHFDSDLVPAGEGTFPAIDIEVHVNASSCLDSVLHVIAAPATSSVVPRAQAIRLAVAPNPTLADVEITVTLPAAGKTRVDVLDVHGRALATLADRVLPEGETRFVWEGRTRSGSDAGLGVFWVSARMGARMATRRFVRVR
jgi:hypothetical protein